MQTFTLELPEKMAKELAGADEEFVIQALQAGLEKARQSSESATDHPYVTRLPRKRGGMPIIRGTGITVSLIARLYKAGDSVDEILESYPHLRPSWVHDAIGYYLDHQDEVEREIRKGQIDYLIERHGLTVNERGFVRFSELDDSMDRDSPNE
jgi:uncharacterized protein (DUF433 family)